MLAFDDSEDSILGKFFSTFLETLLNFLYYCFSYEEFKDRHPIGNTGTFVKTILHCCNNATAEVVYTSVKAFNIIDVNFGKVEKADSDIWYNYEIDGDVYRREYARWMKRSMMLILPGILILLVGICAAIASAAFGLAVFFSVLLILFGYLSIQFKKNGKKASDDQLEALMRWAEKNDHPL